MSQEWRDPASDRTITIFLSSPGDVSDERAVVLAVVERLRYDPFVSQVADLRVVSWDNPAAPVPMLASEHPQQSIDTMLARPSQCDIVIVILWSRLGTSLPFVAPRGSSTLSGTAWEIDDALHGDGAPEVLIYHKIAAATVALGDPDWQQKFEQYRTLRSYLGSLREQLATGGLGMVQQFESLADFRITVDAHLRQLIARRIRTWPPRVGRMATPWAGNRPPYPGLLAFTPADSAFFFGRDREVDTLAELIRKQPLTAVIGPSGSGKSSLVGAGLIPRLNTQRSRLLVPSFDPASGTWSGARITPAATNTSPMCLLAEALQKTVGAAPLSLEDPPATCRELCRQARVLIFVDQFEEIFSPACGAHRAPFLDLVVELADKELATIVLSLRADFLGAALQHDGLARHLRDAILLGPPELSSVSEMIRRPASIAGLRFDPDLPELLLVHARQEPGRLPLLAFALSELYRRRDGDRMTMVTYQEIGGVEGAIGRLAEHEFDRLATEVRDELPGLFRKLVEVDEVGGPIRRKAKLADLHANPQRRALADSLVAARLLVAGTDPGGEPFAELAHEAIFRGWPRFAFWIDTVHEDLLAMSRTRRAAAEWLRAGRDPLFQWPQERIDPAHAAAERLEAEFSATELEFLRPETSRLLDEVARAEVSHVRRREIGVRLAQLGDPRPGVGVGPEGWPDIVWCPVPVDVPLWIAKYPVTAIQLKAFRQRQFEATSESSTGLENDQPNVPAQATWYEAVMFCQWLAHAPADILSAAPDGYVVRLPTEPEWLLAAGGLHTSYPWGDDWDDTRANSAASELGKPIAVGMYPLGDAPTGASDMVGTVWEWCEDDPAEPSRDGLHVLKGGSAREAPNRCRIDSSRSMRGDVSRDDRGFRICLGHPLSY